MAIRLETLLFQRFHLIEICPSQSMGLLLLVLLCLLLLVLGVRTHLHSTSVHGISSLGVLFPGTSNITNKAGPNESKH